MTRNARALAGLSMGGAESLLTGLNNLAEFSWIGAFSAGGLRDDFSQEFHRLSLRGNRKMNLLWMACGKDDDVIHINRQLDQWLSAKDIDHGSSAKLRDDTPGWCGVRIWQHLYRSDSITPSPATSERIFAWSK